MISKEEREELAKAGLTVAPIRTSKSYLDQYDFKPDVVFDIGVQKGTPFLYKAFRACKFVLVDPLVESRNAIERNWGEMLDYEFVLSALGEKKGQLTLNVPIGRKFRRFNEASIRNRIDQTSKSHIDYENREVNVSTLDEVAENHSGRVGIKIDTEGFEMPILKGASETLERADFVILEFSVTKRFDELERPSALIELLSKHGLELRDTISQSDNISGDSRPRFFDMLFVPWGAP